MKINYLFRNSDDDLRAKAVVRAVFEGFNTEIGDYQKDATVTISDKAPAYTIFDGEQTKHPVLGWRLAAKQISEVFFKTKCDVVSVGAKAEEYYLAAVENQNKKKEVVTSTVDKETIKSTNDAK